MSLKAQLLAVANGYCAAVDLSRSRVSTIVFNDGKVLDRLSGSGDITTRRAEAALGWFAKNWPEGAAWPADVPLPLRGAPQ